MTDLEFVQKCVQNDKNSWDGFVDQYSRLIYTYIHSVLKQYAPQISSQDHTNDIFHDLFVSLSKENFKKLNTFQAKNGCSLASWLRMVTVNFTLDYLRKLKHMVSLDEEIGQEKTLGDLIADSSDSVKDTLSREERFLQLKECTDQLDSDNKLFLELHIAGNISLEALRLIFRLSRGAIDMRKKRIIESLRDCFKNKGFEV